MDRSGGKSPRPARRDWVLPETERSRAVYAANPSVTMPVTVNNWAAGRPAALLPVREGRRVRRLQPRPAWLRVLVLAVLGLFCAGVFAVILLVGLGALPELPLIFLFLFVLDAGWVFLCVRRLRKILRTFSRK